MSDKQNQQLDVDEFLRELSELRATVQQQADEIGILKADKRAEDDQAQNEYAYAVAFVQRARERNNSGKYGWLVKFDWFKNPVVMLCDHSNQDDATLEVQKRFGGYNAQTMKISAMTAAEVAKYKKERRGSEAA